MMGGNVFGPVSDKYRTGLAGMTVIGNAKLFASPSALMDEDNGWLVQDSAVWAIMGFDCMSGDTIAPH